MRYIGRFLRAMYMQLFLAAHMWVMFCVFFVILFHIIIWIRFGFGTETPRWVVVRDAPVLYSLTRAFVVLTMMFAGIRIGILFILDKLHADYRCVEGRYQFRIDTSGMEKVLPREDRGIHSCSRSNDL